MKFLDITGLQKFVERLHEKFATKNLISAYSGETDWYILDVDYNQLTFDKNEIVK